LITVLPPWDSIPRMRPRRELRSEMMSPVNASGVVTDRDMIAIPRGNYLVLLNPRGHPISGRIKYRGLEIPRLMEGIEMRKRGALFLPFGVKAGKVEVVYSTATLIGADSGTLRFRNHLSGRSEIALRGTSKVRPINAEIVDESFENGILTLVLEHGDEFEIAF